MFPEKYARRGPDVITAEQLAQVLGQLAERIVDLACPPTSIARRSSRTSNRWPAAFGQTIREEARENEVADDSD